MAVKKRGTKSTTSIASAKPTKLSSFLANKTVFTVIGSLIVLLLIGGAIGVIYYYEVYDELPTLTVSNAGNIVINTCNVKCDASHKCSLGKTCDKVSGRCRNPQCTSKTNCNCLVPTPGPVPGCRKTCTSNSDCDAHLSCVNKKCVNPKCKTSTTCACTEPTPNPTPTIGPVPGCKKACTSNSDCDAHLSCVNKKCVNPQCPSDVNCSCL